MDNSNRGALHGSCLLDKDHHGVLYDQVEMNWAYLRGLVLGTAWGAFFGAFGVLGVSAPPLYLFFTPFL